MGLDTFFNFISWAALTYSWLHINLKFSSAISQAIQNHNYAIRQKALQELHAKPEANDSEPDSESAEQNGDESLSIPHTCRTTSSSNLSSTPQPSLALSLELGGLAKRSSKKTSLATRVPA